MTSTLPFIRPAARLLQADELHEQVQHNLAQHRLNKALAEQAGDLEGVRIASLGILRCEGIVSLLERRAA